MNLQMYHINERKGTLNLFIGRINSKNFKQFAWLLISPAALAFHNTKA